MAFVFGLKSTVRNRAVKKELFPGQLVLTTLPKKEGKRTGYSLEFNLFAAEQIGIHKLQPQPDGQAPIAINVAVSSAIDRANNTAGLIFGDEQGASGYNNVGKTKPKFSNKELYQWLLAKYDCSETEQNHFELEKEDTVVYPDYDPNTDTYSGEPVNLTVYRIKGLVNTGSDEPTEETTEDVEASVEVTPTTQEVI